MVYGGCKGGWVCAEAAGESQTQSGDVTFINYLALPGDANGDMTVDGQDFVIWNANKFTSGND